MFNIPTKRKIASVNTVLATDRDRADAAAEQNGQVFYQGAQPDARKLLRMYPPVLNNADRTLKAGEMAFSVLDPGEDFVDDMQPFVRTVLNGVCVQSRGETDAKKRLMESIRLVGIILADIEFPVGGINNTPALKQAIAIVSGYSHIMNTGDKRIEAGNAVRCFLVDPSRIDPQYKDMKNRFSKNRRVIGYEPVDAYVDLFSEIVDACDAQVEFHAFALSLARAAARARERANENAPVYSVNDYVNNPNDHRQILHSLRSNPSVKKAADHFLAAFRAKCVYDARRVFATALNPADNGNRQDNLIAPQINFNTFAKIKPALELDVDYLEKMTVEKLKFLHVDEVSTSTGSGGGGGGYGGGGNGGSGGGGGGDGGGVGGDGGGDGGGGGSRNRKEYAFSASSLLSGERELFDRQNDSARSRNNAQDSLYPNNEPRPGDFQDI